MPVAFSSVRFFVVRSASVRIKAFPFAVALSLVLIFAYKEAAIFFTFQDAFVRPSFAVGCLRHWELLDTVVPAGLAADSFGVSGLAGLVVIERNRCLRCKARSER